MAGTLISSMQCNESAWYNENMIIAVWESFLLSKQLKYFIFNEEEQESQTESLFASHSLNLVLDSGIILTAQNQLYRNHEQNTLSICGSYTYQMQHPTIEIYLLHLKKAIQQVSRWNQFHEEEKISEHSIIFPYLITSAHWSLGNLKLIFENNQLTCSKIIIHNPMPICGGCQVSEYAKQHLQNLLRDEFSAPNHVLISDTSVLSIQQQSDGTSCGAITAENGKFFLEPCHPNDSQLEVVYPTGARDLRILHIQEVETEQFYAAQLHNEAYTDPQYTKPINYPDILNWFKLSMDNLSQAAKHDLNLRIQQYQDKAHDIDLALAIREFIKQHENDFNSEDHLSALFNLENNAWSFKGDHINTLVLLGRFVLEQCKDSRVKNSQATIKLQPEITQNSGKEISIASLMLDDLSTLIEINYIIEKILDPNQGEVDLIIKLNTLGELYTKIRWCNSSPNCIRNKHGYRNRHKDKGNKINEESVQIHFETLAHLKDLAISQEYQWLLTTDSESVKKALLELQRQIYVALLEERNYATTQQKHAIDAMSNQHQKTQVDKSTSNFLVIVCAYYHDIRCLDRIKNLLIVFQTDKFQKINLKNIIDRYQLGYFFIQVGETAKEISDFVKSETTGKKSENNLTRFLFGKLGKFRQNIKDHPSIVFKKDIRSIILMYLMLSDSASELLFLVELIYEKLMLFLSSISEESLKNIINQYPTFNVSFNKENHCSIFEIDNKEIMTNVIKLLSFGTKDLKKTLETLSKEIKSNKEFIAAKELELKTLQNIEPIMCVSNSSALLSQDLYDTFFSSKHAKKVIYFIENFPEEALEKQLFSGDESDLIRALAKPKNDQKKLSENQIKALQKLIKAYHESVDKAIARYIKSTQENAEDLLQTKMPYSFWVNIAKQHVSNNTESDKTINQKRDAINTKKTSMEKNLCTNEAYLKELKAVSKRVNEYIDSLPNVNHLKLFSPKINYKKLEKFERILIDMINQSSFMQFIHIEIERTLIASDTINHEKYVEAAKLSFAFYGQYYKTIKEDYLDKIKPNLIEHSILSQDCFDAMLLRHKKIAHNTFTCDDLEFKNVLIHKVIPWIKDFKFMIHLLFDEQFYELEIIQHILPTELRLLELYSELNDDDRSMFFIYTKLLSLNRLLRRNEAIDTYEKIRVKILPTSNPELVLEICFQGVVAQRNIGNFSASIETLKFALEFCKKINYKEIYIHYLNKIRYMLGEDYIQIDSLSNAEEYLREITIKDPEAPELYIISSNILLAQIEAKKGNKIVARSILELTLVKYGKSIIDKNKILMIGLLNQLALFYISELNTNAAHDCIIYAENILQFHVGQLISDVGQSITYVKAIHLAISTNFKLSEILLNEQKSESTSKIKDLYDELTKALSHHEVSGYLAKNCPNDFSFNNVSILLGVNSEDIKKHIAEHDLFDIRKLDHLELEDDAENLIYRIKYEIYKFYKLIIDKKGQENVSDIEEFMHREKQGTFTKELIGIYQKMSFLYFQLGFKSRAQSYIKLITLSQYIVDYFEYEFEKIILNDLQLLQSWLESPSIDENELKKYLTRRAYDSQFQQETVYHPENLVALYIELKDDSFALNRLIQDCEINLMTNYYLECGKVVTQIKIDHSTKLLKLRFFEINELGKLIIKERGYASTETQETAKNSRPSTFFSEETPLSDSTKKASRFHCEKKEASASETNETNSQFPRKATLSDNTSSKITSTQTSTTQPNTEFDNLFKGIFTPVKPSLVVKTDDKKESTSPQGNPN